MLTYAIGFVQDVQLICLAILLAAMARHNRSNVSLRWLALAYTAGLAGAVLDFTSAWTPAWFGLGVAMAAAPVGYACLNWSLVQFTGRGRATGWISLGLLGLLLPLLAVERGPGSLSRSATLVDLMLAVQTLVSAGVLLSAREGKTAWPRRAMAAFLLVYSGTEFLRVAVYAITGRMPAQAAPGVEIASGIVYVVSCSALPLAYTWMMNERLLSHLNRQVMVDPLTELLNRRGLEAAAEVEMARCRRTGDGLALLVVDVDHFKRLNDDHAHAGGDAVLVAVAQHLKSQLRPGDVASRMGGDEFVILLPGTSAQEAEAVANRLRDGIEQLELRLESGIPRVTCSFGIALSVEGEEGSWGRLLRAADVALYEAKHEGRNRVRMAPWESPEAAMG